MNKSIRSDADQLRAEYMVVLRTQPYFCIIKNISIL